MKNQKLLGIMPALLTAFDENGIDKKKIHSFSSHLADSGVHGLYVGGSSGEMVLMSVNERKELLETVCDSVSGRCTVIAHIGAMSGSDSVSLAKHAEKSGADALSSVTPLYYKYSFKEIKAYYEALASSTSLPVIIYNIPALTGTVLNINQISELLSIPNVGGMKFTSSDFFQLERLRTEFPDHVFYNGSDEMLLSGLAAGADGGIGTTYNFMPKNILKIYELYLKGDCKEALKVQSKVNRIIELVISHGVLPCSKAILKMKGIDYGICRAPFLPLDESELDDIKALLGDIE